MPDAEAEAGLTGCQESAGREQSERSRRLSSPVDVGVRNAWWRVHDVTHAGADRPSPMVKCSSPDST